MHNKRLIGRLDIKNNVLVKGINMEGLRVIGSPELIAEKYYKGGVDELFYIDVVASLSKKWINRNLKTAEKLFIPLCAGGGLRTIDDVYKLLRAGADKVSINTAAINNPNFVQELAKNFGSSTRAVEILKYEGKYLVFTDNGREYTGLNAIDLDKILQNCGVGEMVITSIDKDGTGLELIMNYLKKLQI